MLAVVPEVPSLIVSVPLALAPEVSSLRLSVARLLRKEL
jgi:hypothetical protein